MGHPLRIYGAGAQVTLYDATNGLFACGYTGEESIVEEIISNAGLSDGNIVPFSKAARFEIPLLETDTAASILNEIKDRRGIKQEVYLVSLDSAMKIRDVFIDAKLERDFKAGGVHRVILTGSRTLETVSAAADLPETNYVQFIQNFLGSFGACSTDGGGGIATGWTNLGATSLSIDTSHLGGGYGNEQRLTLSDTGDFLLCRIRFPLNQISIKFTVSAYFDNRKSGISYFYLGIITRNAAEAALETKQSAEKSIAQGADSRESYTVTFTPSAAVQFIQFYIQGGATGSAELGMDNVQLEVGELTDYVEND